MLASLRSAAVFGLDVFPVHVEVDVTFGLPSFRMVGLPDPSVRESRDRVRSAIRNSGFEFPPHRVTVNLAPADVRKAGSAFDLPIALGVLAASGVVERRRVHDIVLLGELSLDGGIHPARGVLPVAVAARREGRPRHPAAHGERSRGRRGRAAWRCSPVDSLAEAVAAVNGAGRRRAHARSHRCPRQPCARSTSPTSAARGSRGGRWRSPRPAATTS